MTSLIPIRGARISHSGGIKLLLICGILSSLLYTGMCIYIARFYDGYDFYSQTVSELSAVGVSTRMMWVSLGTVYTLLVTLFGYGVWLSGERSKPLRLTGSFLFIYGITGILWPLVPMHTRQVLADGGATITDRLHLVMAGTTVLLMLAAIVSGSFAISRQFKIYSVLTIIVLFLFGFLTALDAPKVQADLPTPWAGLWERINIAAFLLWVIVLALVLLRQTSISSSDRGMT
jgi:hypothetical protein